MNKKILYEFLLCLVFIAVFNCIYYMTGDISDRNAGAWLAYAMIHVVYILVVIIMFSGRHTPAPELNVPVYMISAGYFVIELIAGIIFIAVNAEGVRLQIIVQVVLAGIYMLCVLPVLAANAHTVQSVERRKLNSEGKDERR